MHQPPTFLWANETHCKAKLENKSFPPRETTDLGSKRSTLGSLAAGLCQRRERGRQGRGGAATKVSLPAGADADCFICRAVADNADRKNLLVERTEHSIVLLNRFPYNNGHLLITPRRHQARLDQLDEREQLDMQQLLVRYIATIERTMDAGGFNVGLNLGRVAGAGVPGHLHWHLVPRWNGDTNFMPTIAGLRVYSTIA